MNRMSENSCTRMTWRIRRLGYARKLAAFMARFFWFDEILVWAVAGVLIPLPVQQCLVTSGPAFVGSDCPADNYYVPFGIQR